MFWADTSARWHSGGGVKEIEEIFPISDSFSATLALISKHSER